MAGQCGDDLAVEAAHDPAGATVQRRILARNTCSASVSPSDQTSWQFSCARRRSASFAR